MMSSKTENIILDDGFTLVKSKNSNKNKKQDALRNIHSLREALSEVEGEIDRDCRISNVTKIDAATMHVQNSEYFKTFISSFKEGLSSSGLETKLPFTQIICYGLGCFVNCTIARYQLALLICLKKTFCVDKIELYDPLFSSLEKVILREDLQFSVTNVNEEGKRKVNEMTLFYMPHCSHQLANNLLYCNWNASALGKCVIISNSFKRVVANTKEQPESELLLYISRIEDVTLEYDIENTFQYTDIFNDTAIHIFPRDKLEALPHCVWNENEEPIYSNELFISSKKSHMTN